MPFSRVLCVYGAKGGIGKTTITLNLAGILANMKKEVLIIDLDLHSGDVAVSLDRKPSKTIADLASDLKNNSYHDLNNYLTKYDAYISFLASPPDPRDAAKIDEENLNRILNECEKKYEVIIIDTTNSYDEINRIALKRARKILFVTTNNPLDLKNTRNLLTILKEDGINNIEVLLNNSIHPNNDYFILYDIKKIIQNHINYIISQRFHYRDIDTVTVNGEILTMKSQKWPDYRIFSLIIESLLK